MVKTAIFFVSITCFCVVRTNEKAVIDTKFLPVMVLLNNAKSNPCKENPSKKRTFFSESPIAAHKNTDNSWQKPETLGYLKKIDMHKAGLDLSQGGTDQKTLDTFKENNNFKLSIVKAPVSRIETLIDSSTADTCNMMPSDFKEVLKWNIKKNGIKSYVPSNKPPFLN